MLRHVFLILAVTLLAAAWFSSCDNCSEKLGPAPGGIGLIQGSLLASGSPVESVWVKARTPHGTTPYVRSSALTDSAGQFRIEVPPGEYLIEVSGWGSVFDLVYADGKLRNWRAEPEILSVGEIPLGLDLQVGRASVTVLLQPELDGSTVAIRLLEEGNDRFYFQERAQVAGNRAQADFPLLPLVSYAVEIDVYGHTLSLPQIDDPGGPDSLEVRADRATQVEYAVSAPTRLSGTVTGSWQTLGAGGRPRIHLYLADSTVVAGGTCGTDGSYEVLMPLPEPFRVGVMINDALRWMGGDTYSEATLFQSSPGLQIEDVNLIESGLACRLFGPHDNDLVQAECMVYTRNGRPVFPGEYIDDNGSLLRVSNLLPGSYFLHVRPHRYTDGATWCPQWHSQAELLSEATPISIQTEGEIVQISVNLMKGASISGKVLRASGEPARGSSVIAVSVDRLQGDWEPISSAQTTQRDGFYEIKGLPNGRYLVGIPLSWRFDDVWWYPGKLEPAAADTIEIRNFESVTGIDWQMPI